MGKTIEVELKFDKQQTVATYRKYATKIFREQVKPMLLDINEDDTILIKFPESFTGVSISFTSQLVEEIMKKTNIRDKERIILKSGNSDLDKKMESDKYY